MNYNAIASDPFTFAIAAGLEVVLKAQGAKIECKKDRRYYKCMFDYGRLNFRNEKLAKQAAQATAMQMVEVEPLLGNADSNETVTFFFDSLHSKDGDRRDLILQSDKGWEVGFFLDKMFSRHFRITVNSIYDFGDLWFSTPVSNEYKLRIESLMQPLVEHAGERWEEIYPDSANRSSLFFIPILNAFVEELVTLIKNTPEGPKLLIQQFFGDQDYYQLNLARNENLLKIQSYNLYKTLNTDLCPDMKFPSRLVDAGRKESSSRRISGNTVRFVFDEGWVVNMRLHQASPIIEPNLKMDVVIRDSHPYGMYQTTVTW